ncbi:MAG: beta-ketoacyl-[acyl-carrier-protein] synthase family protein [Myxococcales bacterium]
MRAAWVSGTGAVTPLGATWPETRDALAAGRSAIAPIASFDARGFPSRHAAAIARDFAEPDRRTAFALEAAREAWAAAGLDRRPPDPLRVGVFIGAESGRLPFSTLAALARAAGPGPALDHARFSREAASRADDLDSRLVSPAAVAARLVREFGARGPLATLSLACASGAAAIAEASRAVRQGECDVALAGGVGADVDPLMLAGFGLLGALSASGISRPFDRRRDGFVLGEGAGIVVLSCEGGVARVAGIGRTLDAWNLTAPAPDGNGGLRAMRLALAEAGLRSVDVVQAHGTSTPLNDAIEARAIRDALGKSLPSSHVSSIKGALGHTIAAAGALGFIAAVDTIVTGTVLPTAGLAEPDRDCALPHVVGRALSRRVDSAMVNSFAFGGANCTLVVTRE